MSSLKYNDIVGVRPNFDDTFDITSEKKDSWKSFITNSQFEKNLKSIMSVFTAPISTDISKRKSVWVQGTYGTGKSHSTSVVKHLLADNPEEINEFLGSLSNRQLRTEIAEFRKNYNCFPVVLKGRYTISDVKDMTYQIQVQTRKAIEEAGYDVDIETDYEMAISLLNDSLFESFWASLLDNELKMFCRNIHDIQKELENQNRDILSIIDEKLKGSMHTSFGTTSITDWLCAVQKSLKKQGVADYLVIFWDEFTSLLSGDGSRSILNTVQDIAELSKSLDDDNQPKGVYIFLVTHKLLEQTEAFRSKDIDEQKLALDRFVLCKYEMQPNTTYHILSSTINRKNEEELNRLIDERVKQDYSITALIDRIVDSTAGNSDEIRDKIISLYPFHPYTAYLSTFVSRQLGAAERSVFNFMNDDKSGFKHFITSSVDDNRFLLPSSIWDFYLTINNGNENGKLTEIIGKYNMHFEDVKRQGSKHIKVFKTVLLLNSLNAVVDAGEENNERSLVVPNIKNITDCFAGVYTTEEINRILDYLDQHNIIVKSPDGIFEVSTSTISMTDLNAYMKNAYTAFNDITKVIEESPLVVDDLRKTLTSNNGNTMRKVEMIHLSPILKNSQIESNLNNRVTNLHGFYVVMFYYHGVCDELKGMPQERKQDDLFNNLVAISKKPEFKNVVFCIADQEMTEFEFKRFIESYAKYKILDRNGNKAEAEQAKKNAFGRIRSWMGKILNDSSIRYCFHGDDGTGAARQLAQKICDKYIPFVFSSGLDKLKGSKRETIWEEKKSKVAIESILYQSKLEDVEGKLSGGAQTNLRFLLRDESNTSYIFDSEMNLLPTASKTHPLVELIRAIDEKMAERSVNPTLDLHEKLSFIFDAPFGYYGNMVSYAAVSLAMRKYIDQVFRSDNGSKVDKTAMAEMIDLLFKKKAHAKLVIRFSSKEELELIDLLNTTFRIKGDGLSKIKWDIRETFEKQYKCPIWSMKYLDDEPNSAFNKAVDNLFAFTTNTNENIGQAEIVSLYNDLDKFKTEFSIANARILHGGTDLLGKKIRLILQENNASCTDEQLADYKTYIKQNTQDSMAFWQESNVEVLVGRYLIKLQAPAPQMSPEVPEIPDTPRVVPPVVDSQERSGKVRNLVEAFEGDGKKLKDIILRIIDNYPEAMVIVERAFGDDNE